MKKSTSCPSCGAKLATDSDRCDLCGSEVAEDSEPMPGEGGVFTEELVVAPPPTPTPDSFEPVGCGTCQHVNPTRSRFCNQCGSFLSVGSTERSGSPAPLVEESLAFVPDVVGPTTKTERPPSDVGKRALWMVGVAVVAVIALYALTVVSTRKQTTPVAPNGQPAVATSSSSGSAALPDSMAAIASGLEAEGSAASWAQVGGLYFNVAMQGDETARAELSSRAVDAFDLSLGIEENPDVRTSLAEAAQFDPRNPMRAVIELQAVLSTTPDHVAANYLLGALRARIGRLEDAAQSFQRVIDLTTADEPIHQRAVQDLAAVRQSSAGSP